MSIKDRSKRVLAGGAAAVGLTLGVAALAGAATSPDQTAPTDTTVDSEQNESQDPTLNGSIQTPEDESLSEADEAKALEGLAKISPADAEQAALAAVPGTVNGAPELENEDGSVVYEMEITSADGTVTEVVVDAGNGDVLAQEAGDSEDDEGTESEADEANEADEAPEANEAPEVAPVG
ncbi:MAG: PepSY domain-containing protein [Acidimicrobiales bacterium]|nr:PepSY domain-containing protein [Acidimicrobiales bacterium]